LQVTEYGGEGYLPLVDYADWRVAILRYIDELEPQNLATMQRHDETDEVFVLLAGRCILFIGAGAEQVNEIEIHAQDMEPLKLYNVKRGCWHTHTLSRDATVLIVENRDTAAHNSPEIALDNEQRAKIIESTNLIWSRG
jgi:ureidoglycolate hydrolase